jgi:hypothetical protein
VEREAYVTPGDRERTRYYSSRPRRVPPEFCTDELLEECSVLATLLLYRVISQADDQGRLPGAPKYIRHLCLGMRPEISVGKVEAALTELVRAGFLIRFDHQGRVLLQVDRWHDLQGKWGRRAYASRYAAPPGWTADWISAKPGEPDEPEVRAAGAQDARTVHPPIPVPPPSSLSFPSTGRSGGRTPADGRQEVGGTPRRSTTASMSDDDAFALGTSLVSGAPPRHVS